MSDADPSPRATPATRPADELVLAAVERAALHQPGEERRAVPAWSILAHLALPRRSGAARHVGRRLDAMRAAGWLTCERRHGVPTWALTSAGARRLRGLRRAGRVPPLPESPQHRAWRLARTASRRQITRLREELRERLVASAAMLERDPQPGSDAWLEAAEELGRACRSLGFASYCAREWTEPEDGRRDLDERVEPGDESVAELERAGRRARRAGRRNVALWDRGGQA